MVTTHIELNHNEPFLSRQYVVIGLCVRSLFHPTIVSATNRTNSWTKKHTLVKSYTVRPV